MDISRLKNKLSDRSVEFVAALLLIQPPLDVLSYFMSAYGDTSVTTALRTVLFLTVSAYGVIISQNRRPYYILFGVVGGFWLIHVLNCFRVGYQNPVSDLAEYLKLIQFPLWTFVFITIFRLNRDCNLRMAGLLAANFLMVVLVIGLSFATATPVYTYAGKHIGLLGWFAVPTAQSAIVCMLCLGLLLWAYRTGNLGIFSFSVLLGMGLLYATATRVAYYSALLIAVGFVALLLIACAEQRANRRKLVYVVPLLAMVALLVLLKDMSPMTQRVQTVKDTNSQYQTRTDAILGEDKDYIYDADTVTPEQLAKIRRVYEEVYMGPDATGQTLLEDLIHRFGVEKVMAHYNYTTDVTTLYRARNKKLAYMELGWQEQDGLTHLLGMEFCNSLVGENVYDPENDFPALLYYYGWLGTGLYAGFLGIIFFMVLKYLLKNLRRLPSVLTAEFIVYGMLLVLGLGAAQFSGNVIRRPSVLVYLSLAAAEVLFITSGDETLSAHYERRPAVTMKRL